MQPCLKRTLQSERLQLSVNGKVLTSSSTAIAYDTVKPSDSLDGVILSIGFNFTNMQICKYANMLPKA